MNPTGVSFQERSGDAAPHRFLGLDILRVVAVLLVLGRHMANAPAHLAPPVRWAFDTWKRGGWVGVDLFFVLSGFLVSGLLFAEYRRRGVLSVLRFYTRRGWKIYPAFFFLMGVTLLSALVLRDKPSGAELASEFLFLSGLPSSRFAFFPKTFSQHNLEQTSRANDAIDTNSFPIATYSEYPG